MKNKVFAVITFKNGEKVNNWENGTKIITPIVENHEISQQIIKTAHEYTTGVAFISEVFSADSFDWNKKVAETEEHNKKWKYQ